MRRAEERRSASVMIRSSIRWSLAGNDVDWMMKASEPRTFSWISTKISMSAKRRTTALASCRSRPLAISCAKTGLELPATSLIEPFLADIAASPRSPVDTTLSILNTRGSGAFLTCEVISRRDRSGNPPQAVFLRKTAAGTAILMVNGRRRASAAVRRRSLTRQDGDVAQLGFAVEQVDHAVEHLRRRPVDRFECNRGAAGRRERIAGRPAAGASAERATQSAQHGQQHR